jgi:hypothetical protein
MLRRGVRHLVHRLVAQNSHDPQVWVQTSEQSLLCCGAFWRGFIYTWSHGRVFCRIGYIIQRAQSQFNAQDLRANEALLARHAVYVMHEWCQSPFAPFRLSIGIVASGEGLLTRVGAFLGSSG